MHFDGRSSDSLMYASARSTLPAPPAPGRSWTGRHQPLQQGMQEIELAAGQAGRHAVNGPTACAVQYRAVVPEVRILGAGRLADREPSRVCRLGSGNSCRGPRIIAATRAWSSRGRNGLGQNRRHRCAARSACQLVRPAVSMTT